MYPLVDTKDPTLVEVEVQALYRASYPQGDPLYVPKVFGWAIDCFTGSFEDYQPIDALYHDFEHTLQGTLCIARLLARRHQAKAAPMLDQRMFELALAGILFHDTGYLKRRDDREGTGAKYTLVHVQRSADFASRFLRPKGFLPKEIAGVQNMIRCTGVNVDLAAIPFQNETERIAGYSLGTADLLGQMAAQDYVAKLPILFLEFEEAARFNPGRTAGLFKSVEDLLQKTPLFWQNYVLPKIKGDFLNLYEFLSEPGAPEENFYLQQIERNIDRIRRQNQTTECSPA